MFITFLLESMKTTVTSCTKGPVAYPIIHDHQSRRPLWEDNPAPDGFWHFSNSTLLDAMEVPIPFISLVENVLVTMSDNESCGATAPDRLLFDWVGV